MKSREMRGKESKDREMRGKESKDREVRGKESKGSNEIKKHRTADIDAIKKHRTNYNKDRTNYKKDGITHKKHSIIHKKHKTDEKKEEVEQHKLTNKLIITNKNPTKESIRLCSQLRRTLDPECLSKLREKHPKLRECMEMADNLLISHIMLISGKTIHLGARPNGPTCTFKILEYTDNFKNFSPALYEKPPFLTFQGKSELKQIFERLGRNEDGFRRVLHIAFENELVYLRHYAVAVRNTDDNYRVKLREIGPRLTMKFISKNNGFFTNIAGL